MQRIHPIGKNIVVEEIKAGEKQTEGGIILPPVDKYEQGIICLIVNCGDEVTKISDGDTVIIDKYSLGLPVHINGKEYRITDQDNILAKVV